MPQFRIRSWAEQTLFTCSDYVVEAASLEAAAVLLARLQEAAQEDGLGKEHPAITRRGAAEAYRRKVIALDPDEVVAVEHGLTLVDAQGEPVRDLTASVPTGCDQHGAPLWALYEPRAAAGDRDLD